MSEDSPKRTASPGLANRQMKEEPAGMKLAETVDDNFPPNPKG